MDLAIRVSRLVQTHHQRLAGIKTFIRPNIRDNISYRHKILLMFAFDFATKRAQDLEKTLGLLGFGRNAMPLVVKLNLRDATPRDGVRDNEHRLFIDGSGLLASAPNLLKVVAININHVPIERLVFSTQ